MTEAAGDGSGRHVFDYAGGQRSRHGMEDSLEIADIEARQGACRGGRVQHDERAREERMQLCRASWYRVDAPMPWSVYGADYLRVLSLLRSVERGAVDTLREQLVALAA